MAKQLKIAFLGGVGEIGKNMTAIECGDDIIIIDAGAIFPTEETPGFDLIVPDITYLIENRKKSEELMVKSNLFAIVHHISQYSSPTSCAELSLKNNYDKLKNLLLYIQSNYNCTITVEKAAAICGFSPSHFMKLFKELTGKSFSQYVIDYRLEIAAGQLIETSDKIIDVAENVGFHNISYFTRAFRSKYGETPSAYRDRCITNITVSHP